MAETTEQKGTNLLVALDGSDMCDHVIDWCAKHFSGKTDKIHMVHVVEYSLATVNPRTEFGLDYSELDEVNLATKVKQKAYNKGRKHLEKCGNRFASQGVKSVESKVLLAHPSKSVKGLLCEHADNLKPDVIVCGSRGKGYMGRLFLGSVSDYLMHNAKCTVMVIKDEGVPKPGAKEKKMDEDVPKPGAKEKKIG
eukprot:CAMPEP_0170168736 /NCGR_PEP_ID=MMETSP0040_2-20121228/1685_1 /TAXON_ID=641309 /ORGANISM="Lotharella oceanica, Strain CCMP622" /LENGTH=194 /DNA_ID=CAMNT_0010407067 /DNA_START=124 /DNA_END=708 /DNA_ORIENTATION=+